MFFHAFAIQGRMQADAWRSFLTDAAAAIDMSPVAEAAMWHYPVSGQGGSGDTIVQPITESFLALDTWPDHDGAYLIVCSCRPFLPEDLRFLFHKHGLVINDEASHRLEIR